MKKELSQEKRDTIVKKDYIRAVISTLRVELEEGISAGSSGVLSPGGAKTPNTIQQTEWEDGGSINGQFEI